MPYDPGLIGDPNNRLRTGNHFINDGTAGTGSRYSNPVFSAGPVYDVLTRRYVQGNQGTPYTGVLPGGGFSNAGIWTATNPTAVTDPAILANRAEGKPDDFPRLYTTVQQPAVANIAAAGLAAQPAQAAASQNSFERYRQESQAEIDKTRATAPAAYDTSATEAELRGANTRYEGASGETLAKMEARNKEFEEAQNRSLEAKQNELRTYEGAAQAVADRSVANARRAASAAMVGLGPDRSTGWSGARSNREARIYSDINLPLQRELSGLRTGLIGEGMGLEREYLGNDRTTMQFEQALNESFRGNTVATAQYLQNLRAQMRGLSIAEQGQLLAREADMLGLGQRLRSGEITIAGMLAALEKSATDYTYRQPFDPSRIAPTASYSPVAPTPNYRPNDAVPVIPGTSTGTTPTPPRPIVYPPMVTPPRFPTENRWNQPSGGWGFVNGEYIGRDADFYNDALSGPVVGRSYE